LLRKEALPFHPLHRSPAKVHAIWIEMSIFGFVADDQNGVTMRPRATQEIVQTRVTDLNSKPHPRAPTVLCNELNPGLFESPLHRVDSGSRDVAARFFKTDDC
jgi:hypothetical protein